MNTNETNTTNNTTEYARRCSCGGREGVNGHPYRPCSHTYLDRFGTAHTDPDCAEFHQHEPGSPNNYMPAFYVPAHTPVCADCEPTR